MSEYKVRKMYEKITQLIDEELEERVNVIINEFATIISKKHAIPLEHLLKEIPITQKTICRGKKKNGQRCTSKASIDGYCGMHTSQGARVRQRIPSSSNIHNHGPDKMFVKGCPGCDESDGLIDLGI